MQGDLTTLGRVKDWLSGQSTISSGNDALLRRLVSSASQFVYNYINRQLAVQSYNEWYDGGGNRFLSLRQFPIYSISSIQFGGITVSQPASGNPPVGGYLIQPPSRVDITDYWLPRGRSVINVQYEAGYATKGEAYTVPGGQGPYTVQTTRAWLGDLGVTLAGTALTPVSGAPAAGQYSVSQDATSGETVYTFNAAQAGAAVLLSYSSVPPDLEQAVIELVGERFRQRDRIGLTSKNLAAGETVAFLNKDMSEGIRMVLERYCARGSW